MDVHHNLDKYGHDETRGVFKMKPEKAYRYSQYFLILVLIAIDILFVTIISWNNLFDINGLYCILYWILLK